MSKSGVPEEEEQGLEISLTSEQMRKLPPKILKKMVENLGGIKKNLAVGKLFKGVSGSWELVSEGCLFLVEDKKVLTFHLLNLETAETIWTHELYENITIHLLQDYFAAFEGDDGGKTCMWGISFAHVYDGKEFCMKTMTAVEKRFPKKKKTSLFAGIKNFFSDGSGAGGKKRKTKKSKPKRPKKPKRSKKKKNQQRVVISSPKNFQKRFHIGKLEINEEWMNFLTKDMKLDLQNEEIVERIFTVLKSFEKKQTPLVGGGGGGITTTTEESLAEERKLRKEMEIMKEIEDIEKKIRDLEKKKEELKISLKHLFSSPSSKNKNKEEEEEYEGFEDFFDDADEEDWIEAGSSQVSTPLPPGSPSVASLPPPFPPPDISKLDADVERRKEETRIKREQQKQQQSEPAAALPKLTEEVKMGFMELMKLEMERRRGNMNIEYEEKKELEQKKKKKGSGDGDWSDEEKENLCNRCGDDDASIICTRCKKVWYCSKECQTSDLKVHKKDCKMEK